ncbi:MAG: hypothetical protein HYU66_05765, partial [Armatimonadetes bacterium]|nr:hypothetical protein [Armatimonadota bacterium]
MAFGVGGAFACNWFWRDMPDVIFPWGLFRQDRVPRPWVADMAAITLATRAVRPVYEPPALYLLIPDQHRLGPRFGDIDRALTNAIGALSSLSVPFGLLHENDLAAIPAAARAILWPLPYCPTDAVFETVRKWVECGGRLYVSGSLGYDEGRKPTRGARYAALGLPEQPLADPFEQRAYGQPATGIVGQGKVTLIPEPAELRGGLRERYAAFLAEAGIQRLASAPDSREIQCATVASRDGSRAWVAANWGQTRDITLGGVTVAAAANDAVLVHLGQGDELRGVLAQGAVTVAGKAVVGGPACLLQSRDGKDVRESAALLLMPLATGELSVATSRTWQAPVAVTGEVRAGKWHELARTKPRVAGGTLKLTADEALVGTAILIAEPGSVAKLADELVAELRLR